ncbi:MAG TPA: hypothetical protein HA346_02540 [Thermoplasmata archaeon]|nr:hypothetical protein [Thermoplasmata archaeon]
MDCRYSFRHKYMVETKPRQERVYSEEQLKVKGKDADILGIELINNIYTIAVKSKNERFGLELTLMR